VAEAAEYVRAVVLTGGVTYIAYKVHYILIARLERNKVKELTYLRPYPYDGKLIKSQPEADVSATRPSVSTYAKKAGIK
jgi:hypothetical protein